MAKVVNCVFQYNANTLSRFVLLMILVPFAITTETTAQAQIVLSMESPTLDLQTGQEYEIAIRVDDLSELWLASVNIGYDPQSMYIMGTEAGSPVQSGPLFTTDGTALIVRNFVNDNQLTYAISRLAPSAPITGSGIIGTFRIFPLTPGTTQLLFSEAELVKLNFTDTETGRSADEAQPLSFVPVLLELNISGEPVEPPDEATVTPTPTATQPGAIATRPTIEPRTTLVNVTAVPHSAATGTLLPTLVPQADSGFSTGLLAVGIGLMLSGGLGLILLFMWKRSR